jgi:hypothetical protein
MAVLPTTTIASVALTTLMILLHGAPATAVAAEKGETETSRLMTIADTNVIEDTDTTAFQTATEGGMLETLTAAKTSGGMATFLLTMHGVSKSTAILSNMHNPEAGAKAAPLNVIHDKLPKFALLFINKNPPHHTSTAASEHDDVSAAPPDYMVIGLDLQELDMVLDKSLLSDEDAAGSSSTTLRYRCTMRTMPYMLGASNLTMPLQFTEAALLIDLIKYDDMSIPKAKREMTLGHMASTGELAYNMQKHVSQQGDWKDDAFQVQAQGIMTIGWIPGSWSLWAWICCPAWLLTCPLCTVTVLLCCV